MWAGCDESKIYIRFYNKKNWLFASVGNQFSSLERYIKES